MWHAAVACCLQQNLPKPQRDAALRLLAAAVRLRWFDVDELLRLFCFVHTRVRLTGEPDDGELITRELCQDPGALIGDALPPPLGYIWQWPLVRGLQAFPQMPVVPSILQLAAEVHAMVMEPRPPEARMQHGDSAMPMGRWQEKPVRPAVPQASLRQGCLRLQAHAEVSSFSPRSS